MEANQEPRWNTFIPKSHHSTPEVSSPISVLCWGLYPSAKLHFPTMLWPGSSADAHLPTYTREEYCSLWKMQWSQWVTTLFVGICSPLPPNSVIVEGIGRKKAWVKGNTEEKWAWILSAYSTAAAILCRKWSSATEPSKNEQDSRWSMENQLSRKRGHSVLPSDSHKMCQPAFIQRSTQHPVWKPRYERSE